MSRARRAFLSIAMRYTEFSRRPIRQLCALCWAKKEGAIYARVSTDEQTTANQLEELKRWAKNTGHAVGKPSRFYEFTP